MLYYIASVFAQLLDTFLNSDFFAYEKYLLD